MKMIALATVAAFAVVATTAQAHGTTITGGSTREIR